MKKWQAGVLFLVCLSFFAVAGCGKKGPPFLPKRAMPFAVTGLMAEVKDGMILFHGRIIGQEDHEVRLKDVIGCRVYHTRFPIDNPPCESCPIEYQLYKEIRENVIKGRKFFCRVLCPKKEGLHFFRIRLIGPDNVAGPPSDMVKITLAP